MISVNLVPPKIKQKIQNLKNVTRAKNGAIFTIIIFLLIGFSLKIFNLAIDKNIDQTQINQKNNQAKTNQKQVLAINDRAKLAIQIKQSQIEWSTIIETMNNNFNSNLTADQINLSSTQTPNASLLIRTSSEKNLTDFKNKITASNFAKNVFIKNSAITALANDKNKVLKVVSNLEFDINNTAKETNE